MRRCDTPSYRENADGYLLTAADMRWFWDHYLGEAARRRAIRTPRRCAPRRCAGLPPALVITAEFDPLRDEGEALRASASRRPACRRGSRATTA